MKKTTTNKTTKTVVKNSNTTKSITGINELINNISSINDLIENISCVDNDNNLLLSSKNNLQLALFKCGYIVNGNSANYRPLDAYMRFNNACQFQLHYNKKSNSFDGFNIRVRTVDDCETVNNELNNAFIFTKCIDNARNFKSQFINFEHFANTLDCISKLA